MSRPMGAAITEVARQRELASDKRAGSYARRIARQRQYAFLRQVWKYIAVFLAFCATVLIATAQVMPSDFARGLLLGGGLVAVSCGLWQWVVQATGTAPTMMGDLGEQRTASELRKLRRRGWRLVNHLTLRNRDIDHVLVGPGGLLAIETKWSAQRWRWSPPDEHLVEAARTAQANAHDLQLWHELKSLGVADVRPVVFVWQGAGIEIPRDAVVAGTRIVTGRSAKQWRVELGDGVLTPEQVQTAWHALDRQCRVRDPREEKNCPLYLSPGEWLIRLVFAFVAACAGCLAVSIVVATSPPLWASLGWWLLMLGLGFGVARVRRARYLGLGWTAGVAATAMVVVLAMVAWLL